MTNKEPNVIAGGGQPGGEADSRRPVLFQKRSAASPVGALRMAVDVGSRDFKVLLTGCDLPGEEKLLVPYDEIPPELLPIIEAQPLRYAIPAAGAGPTPARSLRQGNQGRK